MFKLKDLGVSWSKEKTSGGVPVNFFEKKGSPVGVIIAFPIGSKDDPTDKEGLVHQFEHLLLDANENLHAQIERLGGWINGYTSKEEMAIYAQFGDFGDFDKAAKLPIDTFCNFAISDKILNNAKNVVTQELLSETGNAPVLLDSLRDKAFFKNTSYEHHIIGTEEDIKTFSLEDITRVHKHVMSLSPVVLVIGEVDKEKALAVLDKSLPFKTNTHKRNIKRVNSDAIENKIHKTETDFINTSIAFKGVPVFDSDMLILDFIVTALGRGSSSILVREVRKKLGLVYDIRGRNIAYAAAGVVEFNFGVNKTEVAQVADCIQKQIDLIKSDGLKREDLELTKKRMLKSAKVDYESLLSLGFFHITGELFSPGNYLDLEKYINAFQRVSNTEIVTTARKYLNRENMGICAVGNISNTSRLF